MLIESYILYSQQNFCLYIYIYLYYFVIFTYQPYNITCLAGKTLHLKIVAKLDSSSIE